MWWGTDIGTIDLQQGIHNKHVQLHPSNDSFFRVCLSETFSTVTQELSGSWRNPTLWLYLSRWSHLRQQTLHRFNPAWKSAAWPTNPSLGISLLRQAITDQPDLHDKTSSLFGYATLITADLLKSTCTIDSCPYSIHMKYFYVEMEETDLVCTLKALLK